MRIKGESQILCKHCIAVQKRMIFYDEGTAYLPFPCSHYNGNTVLVSRAAAKAAVHLPLMPGRFAVSRAFDPQNRSPDWSKFCPNPDAGQSTFS